MKTRIILLLVCLISIDVMGQGIVRRQQKEMKQQVEQQANTKQKLSKKNNQGSSSVGNAQSVTNTSNAQTEIHKLLKNMVYVEGGTFTMGGTADQGDEAGDFEKPTHQTTLDS